MLPLLLSLALTAGNPSDEVVAMFEQRVLEAPAAGDQPAATRKYRLLRPEKIESGKRYPLIVFLHGAGERGDDNRQQLTYLPTWMLEPQRRAEFNAFLLAPQCPKDRLWAPLIRGEQIDDNPPELPPPDELKLVERMIERELAEQPIDVDRVYLTGLSMGGFGSWRLAADRPELFAAVAPICGGGQPRRAPDLAGLPLWVFHGDRDNVIHPQQSRAMVEAVQAAGGNVQYTEFEGVTHDSWTPAYIGSPDLLRWMFAQRRGN